VKSTHLGISVITIATQPRLIPRLDPRWCNLGPRKRIIAQICSIHIRQVLSIGNITASIIRSTAIVAFKLLLEGFEVIEGFFLGRLFLLFYVGEIKIFGGSEGLVVWWWCYC
jgi:hypothetical protein